MAVPPRKFRKKTVPKDEREHRKISPEMLKQAIKSLHSDGRNSTCEEIATELALRYRCAAFCDLQFRAPTRLTLCYFSKAFGWRHNSYENSKTEKLIKGKSGISLFHVSVR